MAVLVKAVTKELEPAGSLNNSCRRLLSHFELQSSYMEQTSGETLLEMRKCLTEFVLFSHRYICKPLRLQKNYLFGRFSQSNSCFVGVNLLLAKFPKILSEICPK